MRNHLKYQMCDFIIEIIDVLKMALVKYRKYIFTKILLILYEILNICIYYVVNKII